MNSLSLVFLLISSCLGVHDLDTRYKFRRSLHSRYTLYWNYNPTLRNISFAVRVQTTGWVGFGISPNGDMTGSDVVIGWVQNDRTYFNDRFASARATPTIDEQQDWMLVDSEEENGFTTLEFTRNYTSCDPNDQDRNITDGTSRVVWSFNDADPVNGVLLRHDIRGSTSINLLGGLRNASADPPGTQSFSLRVNQITIPSTDTTYWCEGFELPQAVQDDEKYIIRFAPAVTEGNTAHVHHMVLYTCPEMNATAPGGPCRSVDSSINACLGETFLAAWAVGGEGFVLPPNIALAIGGNNGNRYAVIQMHYDNPDMLSGVVDSSGMTFYYIDTPRQHTSELMEMGRSVNQYLVIPPKSTNFTVYGFCSAECTMNFPADGIRLFANSLHTHLLGVRAKLYHLRRDQQTCSTGDGFQELKPVDSNPNYDFNFQDVIHIEEVVVKPGDVLMVSCTYDSSRLNAVTLGGLSTHEEMCLTFFFYYPRANISGCKSFPIPSTFSPFVNYVNSSERSVFENLFMRPYISRQDVTNSFNQLNWTPQQLNGLEDTLRNGQHYAYCHGQGFYDGSIVNATPIDCPYSAPQDNLECPDSVSPPSGGYTIYGLTVFALLVIVMITLIIY